MLQPGSALFRVPETISDPVAASANCATATVAAVLRAGGEVRDRTVLIFGAGMLGLTASALARSLGAAAVIVSDPDPGRRELATTFGATKVCSAEAKEVAAVSAEITSGRGVDLALELAGSGDAVKVGLGLTRIGGTLVLAGTVLPTPGVSFDPEAVVRRLLTIRGVHNYAPRDLGTALDFLAGAGKAFPFAKLIHRTFALQNIEAAFQYAHQQGGGRVAVTP
jgi:alcohol dehydrogenase